MIVKVEDAIKRELEDNKKVNPFSSLSRNDEFTTCNVGDILQMPADKYRIIKSVIPGTNVPVQSTIVENQNGEVRRIYPSMFQRNIGIYTMGPDGKVVPTGERAKASGTAADLFKTFIKVDDAMNAFLGKKLEIKAIDRVKTQVYGSTTQLREQAVYTIDIVEE